MSGRRSAATERAIYLWKKQPKDRKNVYEAADIAGVAATTLYRAIEADRKKQLK